MITKEQLEALKASCPRCRTKLKLDEMGCPACYKCRDELSLEEYVDLTLNSSIFDSEIWIIDPTKYDSSKQRVKKDEV